MKKFLLLLSLCLGLAISALGYSRIAASTGAVAHWASMPINYFINEQGSSQINNDSEFAAVHASFQTWANVSTANARFNYVGPATASAGANDGINLISFNDTTFPWGSGGTLAVTLNFFNSQSGITSEADILFNPGFGWSTSGESGKYDIQSVLTHEIGHFLGLDHSGIVSSVMTPFGFPGQVDQRTLQYDDIAGVSEIYPAGNPSVGRISGSVTKNGSPLKSAHVVAVDSDGTPRVGTMTSSSGIYTLPFLPPGTYRVYAEPLDGPVSLDNLGSFFSAGGTTDFGTTYYPNASRLENAQIVQVTAGATTSIGAIQAMPRSASSLNITRPIFAPRIPRGASGTLSLAGFDLSNGTSFSSSNPDVVLGGPFYNTNSSPSAPTSAAIQLSVSSGASLGPRNIAVNRGTDASVATGTIVVVDTSPTGIGFSPVAGAASGGTRVTVTGSNFRSGARVYFGGIVSTDARFVNSETLDVLLPPNLPGSALVLVMNSDGTNGVSSSGFAYEALPPTISSVSPLSGPPTTMVTIDGTNFDPFSSQVSFNGVAAHVSSATGTRIVTAVPYGATTGNVTVVAYGIPVVGPVFTVTAPSASTNLAPGSYGFTDASAGAGGSTLSFASNDDGSTPVTLPFTFSLFRDIYLAGSQITVTTNGFLSLESGAGSEFQNGPLPSPTSQKVAAFGCFTQSAETRIVPRSLIAPFFDDLVSIAGVSSVSTRVVGSAPNRKLIIQWSRMSVLDESGCDLHSTLSFQAILFEGSNDIQFIYESLSGPRSDGVGASIGLQDFARTTGIQTGFNESKVRTGGYITYRFSNGSYTVTSSDPTPPTTPVVLDGGAQTNSTSSLSASWSSSDPESGVREYQYALGTTSGGTDLVPFTTITTNFVTVTGLSLSGGSTYYFSVRAVNNDGLTSSVGVSDGIQVNLSLTFSSKVIPFVQHTAARYSGIALLAPSAMSVTLTAISNVGATVGTTTVNLNPGQQYARLITELFSVSTFEGWIEVTPSAPGLGVFYATGSRDNRDLDGAVPRDLQSDFIALHAGATLWMVNPASQAASVTITPIGSSSSTSVSIPARSRVSTTLAAASRVISTQALAALEVMEGPNRLAMSAPEAANGTTSLTFPHGVIGGGYATSVILVNLGVATTATVQFRGASSSVPVAGNATTVIALNSLFPIPNTIEPDAVRVSTPTLLFGSANLVGVVDIANPLNLVSLGTRPTATEFIFPQVAHGGELFTGLCFVTGSAGATITVDIYSTAGDVRRSNTVTLGANQQLARLINELVPSVQSQLGGYIRIRSDQPILSWEIYGSGEAFASGPPL